MLIKLLFVIVFFSVLYNLGRGLYFLMREKGSSPQLAKALTWRIGLSIGLFFMLLLAAALGWITPHGV